MRGLSWHVITLHAADMGGWLVAGVTCAASGRTRPSGHTAGCPPSLLHVTRARRGTGRWRAVGQSARLLLPCSRGSTPNRVSWPQHMSRADAHALGGPTTPLLPAVFHNPKSRSMPLQPPLLDVLSHPALLLVLKHMQPTTTPSRGRCARIPTQRRTPPKRPSTETTLCGRAARCAAEGRLWVEGGGR